MSSAVITTNSPPPGWVDPATGPETVASATDALTANDVDLASILRAYNDVTERLKRSHEALGHEVCRLRDEIQQKNKELERRERLAALGQMAAGVAHEIRNPLGGVRLYASLLGRDLVDRPDQLDLVRRLESGIRNMESIVGDILAFAGDVEPRLLTVRVGGIIAQMIVQAAPQAEDRGVVIQVDHAQDDVPLLCDARQVQRALLNVVLNACEAVERGGCVTVRTTCDRAAQGPSDRAFVHFHVEDDGPGIKPASLDNLFNPFFTTKDSGTGLGLAIVHRIAEAHKGRVTAANRPGGGAVFVLSIPLANESPAMVEA